MWWFLKKRDRTDKYSKEWFQNALDEIDTLEPKKQERPAIQYSSRIDFDLWEENIEQSKTFQEKLKEFISEKGMTNTDFYKAARIDRKLFSAMNTNTMYKPKKETVAACCFGLKLSLSEAEDLLGAAGYYLSLSIPWDRVIYYCLKNEIYDIDIVNDLLEAKGERGIRTL